MIPSFSDLQGADLRWLLVLTIRGEPYRFSTTAIDVSSDQGSLRFRAGLSPLEFVESAAPPGGTVSDPAARVEVRFSGTSSEGWAALSEGSDLGDISAELSLLIVGRTFESRRVILDGLIASAEGGAQHEPVTLGLTGAPWRRQPKALPRNTYRVTEATWDHGVSGYEIGEGVSKQLYPEIVGAPGYRNPNTGGTFPAVPALLAKIHASSKNNNTNSATVIVGAGRLKAAGVASVKIFNATQEDTSAALTPTVTLDDLGQPVTVVAVGHSDLAITSGDELWLHFTTPGNGGRFDTAGNALRSVDEVIRWLLESSGARADYERIKTDLRWLRGLNLDLYLNESVDPLAYCLDQIVPLFPISVKIGPAGVEFRRWPFDATSDDAVMAIDIDRVTGERLSTVNRSDPGEVVNLLTVRFARNGATDSFQGEFTFAPSARVDQTDREVHPYATASANRYGEREGAAIESDAITDRATAAYVGGWQIRYYSQTREAVRYALPQEFQALQTGDVVTITDAAIGWDDRVCVVSAVTLREGPTEVLFETIPDWIRDTLS